MCARAPDMCPQAPICRSYLLLQPTRQSLFERSAKVLHADLDQRFDRRKDASACRSEATGLGGERTCFTQHQRTGMSHRNALLRLATGNQCIHRLAPGKTPQQSGTLFLFVAADLAHQNERARPGIGEEYRQQVSESHTLHLIAADPDPDALSKSCLNQTIAALIGQGATLRHDSERARAKADVG